MQFSWACCSWGWLYSTTAFVFQFFAGHNPQFTNTWICKLLLSSFSEWVFIMQLCHFTSLHLVLAHYLDVTFVFRCRWPCVTQRMFMLCCWGSALCSTGQWNPASLSVLFLEWLLVSYCELNQLGCVMAKLPPEHGWSSWNYVWVLLAAWDSFLVIRSLSQTFFPSTGACHAAVHI